LKPYTFKFLFGQLEHKILRKPLYIAFYGQVQGLGLRFIKAARSLSSITLSPLISYIRFWMLCITCI
jgi:hypothetical protein